MPRSKSPMSSSLKKSSAKPQAEPKRRGRRIALAAFFVSEFVGHAHQSRQLLRRHRQPALAQPLADRIPVGVAQIEPHPDPALAEIGRPVITRFVHLKPRRLLVAPADLEEHSDFSVAYMVLGEICEFLSLHDP